MKKGKLFIAGVVCCIIGVIGLYGLITDFSTDLLGGSLAVIVAGIVLILMDRKENNSVNTTNNKQQYQSFNYQQMSKQQTMNQTLHSQQVQQPVKIQQTNTEKVDCFYISTIATMDRDCGIEKDPGEYSQEKEFTVVGVTYEGRQNNLAMLCDTEITDAELEWTTYKDEEGIKVYFEGLEMGWVSRKDLPFFTKYDGKIRYISNAFVGNYRSGEYFARFRVRYYAPK